MQRCRLALKPYPLADAAFYDAVSGLGKLCLMGQVKSFSGLRSFGCITQFGEMTKLDRLRSWRMADQERHEALRDLQRSLTQLHQVFLDMAVMVEKQGEQMDDIEQNVADAGAYIHGGTNALFSALKLLTGLFQSRYMNGMEVNDSSSKDLEGNAGHFYKKSEHHDGIDSGPDDSSTIEKKDIPTEINFEEEVDIARKVLNNLIASATETSHDDRHF
ncbi:hypothetical protein GBA52_027069 [Prunus armeniaca]|nr:hypothetical protein GBA52_027069 [Prunus armeniaca]